MANLTTALGWNAGGKNRGAAVLPSILHDTGEVQSGNHQSSIIILAEEGNEITGIRNG